jgi:hypothetical protein
VVQTKQRARPERVKQQIVEQRQFTDIQLLCEEVAEMPYRPVACRTMYRVVIVRKNLRLREPKQGRLFETYRYFLMAWAGAEVATMAAIPSSPP